MGKMLISLFVLAMSVCAFADVTWSEDNSTAGTSIITWTSSEPLAGLALELTVMSGELDSVEMTGFNVYIDQAYSTPGFTNLEEVNTNPAANADAPGDITDLTGKFTICGGSLTEDHAGVSTGTITLTASVEITVDIVADETRGGAVSIGGESVDVIPVTATIAVILESCWNYPYFTNGDADGDGDVDTDDWPIFRDAFGTAEGDAAYSPCADFDKDGDVDTDDWPTFRDNFGKSF